MDNNQNINIHEFPNFDEDEPQFSPRQEYKRKRLLFSPPRRVIPTSGTSIFLENNYLPMPLPPQQSISPGKKHCKTPQNVSEEQQDVFIRKQGHTRPVTPSRRLFSPPSGVTTTTPISDLPNLQVAREVDNSQIQENLHHVQQEYIKQDTLKHRNSSVSPKILTTQVAANKSDCNAVFQDSPVHEVHISIPEYVHSPCGSTNAGESNYSNFEDNHIEINLGGQDSLCHQNELPLSTNQQLVEQDVIKLLSSGCNVSAKGSIVQTDQRFDKETVPKNFVQYTEQQFDRLWKEVETLRDTVDKQSSQIKLQNELIQKLQAEMKTKTKSSEGSSSSSSSSSCSSSSSSSDNCNLSSDSDDDNDEKKDDRPNQPNELDAEVNIEKEKISATETVEMATPNKISNIKVKAAPSKYVCSVCSREYKTGMALTCHMTKTHNKIVQSETVLQPQVQKRSSSATVCTYCDKIFHNQIRCQQHIKVVHERFRIQCDRCGGYFSDHQKLKEHLKEHDNDGITEPVNLINPLYCTALQKSRKKCRERFNCKQSLRHHLWRKHFITGEEAEKSVERAVLNSNVLGAPQVKSSCTSGIPSISSQP